MKIGVSVKMRKGGYDRFGIEKYKIIKKHGFDCVDFDMSNTANSLYHLDEKDFEKYLKTEKALSDIAGIEIYQTHGPWTWPIKDFEQADRIRRLGEIEKSIYATSILGSKYFVIHPLMPFGIDDIDKGMEKETREINLSFIKKVLEKAKKYGVTVCLENTPFPKFSLATPGQISNLIREIDEENLKMCLDTGHIAVFGDKFPGNAIREFKEDIRVLHIHDNGGEKDEHLSPHLGIIDWNDFSSALKEINFDGNLSLEIVPKESLPTTEFEIESIKLAETARTLAEKIARS